MGEPKSKLRRFCERLLINAAAQALPGPAQFLFEAKVEASQGNSIAPRMTPAHALSLAHQRASSSPRVGKPPAEGWVMS